MCKCASNGCELTQPNIETLVAVQAGEAPSMSETIRACSGPNTAIIRSID